MFFGEMFNKMKLILTFLLLTLGYSDMTYPKKPAKTLQIDMPVRKGYRDFHGCSDVRHGR
jgi:hypothetical protein